MTVIQYKPTKANINFGNTDENQKSGNTGTALGVGLVAGGAGSLVGYNYLGKPPTSEQIVSEPDKFIPSNLSGDEEKAAEK